MSDRFFPIAVSLAKMLLETRERFAESIRMAAIARIEENPRRCIFAGPVEIPRCAVEPHVDDAFQAIGRDGLRGLEDNVRFAIDEIVREMLNFEQKGALGGVAFPQTISAEKAKRGKSTN